MPSESRRAIVAALREPAGPGSALLPEAPHTAPLRRSKRLPITLGFSFPRCCAAPPAEMKFAHLIEINDPLNPLLDPLSRAQIWRGLVLRATTPTTFVPHLDRCTLLEQSGLHLVRELQFGDVILRDKVRFLPQQQVIYEVPAQEGIPPSRLTMTIEEPEPDVLFVRFEYENEVSAEQDAVNAMYDDFRRSAYKESDIDTIRVIRQLAEAGHLGS